MLLKAAALINRLYSVMPYTILEFVVGSNTTLTQGSNIIQLFIRCCVVKLPSWR